MPHAAASAKVVLPTLAVESAERAEDGAISLITLLREAKFSKSNSEARRLISQGGVKWDGEAIQDIGQQFPSILSLPMVANFVLAKRLFEFFRVKCHDACW